MIQAYFLGANSADGFFSCYDCFCSDANDFLYIIKGGPGSGKSTFMKKIGAAAEAVGLDVEYVRCSGDPDSLDGVYLPQRHLGYVDGTAPHVIEPKYPGVSGCYLDFSRFFDVESLRCNAGSIRRLGAAYKAAYRKAYDRLAVHAEHKENAVIGKRRFRHAVTCQGVVTLPVPKTPKQISKTDLAELQCSDVIWYLHPLQPDSVIGAYCPDSDEYFEIEATFPDCSDAIAFLSEAKMLHDELEACYRPYVDFGAIDELTQSHIKKALSDPLK